jgi:phosphopantothenoylcysteine decarboxylase/phosphopantothenate--cysteine ligase
LSHPSLDIVESYGTELTGKNIVLCVAGSVAAYKSIELARLLMRHGANVKCVMSNASTKLIKPDYMKWATGNNVITKLTGDMEHIELADYKRSDLLIVYPSTANPLGKLATGIDDTPISTVLTVAFGSKIPIIMGLAMHRSMYENAAVKNNMDFLRKKIDFVSPQMIEGKAKAPEPEDMLSFVLKKFGGSEKLRGKKVLMTAGPTIEKIDPVRFLSNRSSGKQGHAIANALRRHGADTNLISGPVNIKEPENVKVTNINSAEEMLQECRKNLPVDIAIFAAAVSDWNCSEASNTKIKKSSEGDNLTINLQQSLC